MYQRTMISKTTVIRLLTSSIAGYTLMHPITMIISFLMAGKPSSHPSSVATDLFDQIAMSFSIDMLPWGLSFALLGCLAGFYYDKQKQADEEKSKLIEQLQASLSEIDRLSGLLPICASCKKIRDDKGYWNQIEVYIKDHSEAEFSHGICPECAVKIYPAYKGIN